jgi:Regulator of chromosome condensation (RCC1) repeat/Bacterial Ig-like domain (group 2)
MSKSLMAMSGLLLAGCEGPFVPPPPYAPPPPPPASVQVSPDSATVITDDTLRLSAVVRDSTGQVLAGIPVAWSSADTTILTVVNALGTVRGQRPGATTIRATAGPASGRVTVFVTPVVFNAFATGANHACGVANNHHAYCWGDNDDAEVGTGSASFLEAVPRKVLLATAVQAVTAGSAHSCALDLVGAAYCWGRQVNGRLGRGSLPGDPAVPSAVTGGIHFVALSAGGAHTCGVATTARIFCWGADGFGQLGDGGGPDRPSPQGVIGDAAWIAVSAGTSHTCAIALDLIAACWGANADGQLGDSTTADHAAPAPVAGRVPFLTITAGGNHTCALATGGVAYCWGQNVSGETGSGQADSALLVPAAVAGGLSFLQIAAGGQHTCGIASDSLAYCWGVNTAGQLGDSSQIDHPTPAPVQGGLHFAALQAGATFTCGLTAGFVLYCWGDGTQGQLGRTAVGSSTIPVRVAGQ